MDTANAANAGADRGHSRRTKAPGRKHRGQAALEEPRVGGAPLRDLRRVSLVPSRMAQSQATALPSPRLGDMQRIIGTEVEYGISSPSDPTANPILTSTQAVLAYAAAAGIQRAKRTRWDYEVESPLRDARGFDLSRSAGPPPVVDADEVGAANMILTNGARLYVDHAHPEYSAPECTDPMDAVIWDKAGERVMEAAARHVASVPGAAKLQLYKNNVDGKGASYGSHENYLMSRQTPFSAVIAGLTPFLVSRQVITGSGRVGIGPSGDEPGFQLSQRADYIEVEVGLETTLKRGIINTRDEPHADADKYRRLHVIIGDANLAETSTYLKLGTTSLVLDLIEEGVDLTDLALARPVHAVHVISRDPSLRATVALADGRELTALALQRIYLDRVAKLVDSRDPDPRAADVVADLGARARPARAGPDGMCRDLGLAGETAVARGLPQPGEPQLVGAATAPGGPAVLRRASRQGSLQPAGRARLDEAAGHRTAGARRRRQSADGHPRLLPRRVPAPLRRRHRRRQLGLGDLRPRRGFARPDSNSGAAAGQQSARRGAAGLRGQRRRIGRTAHRTDAPAIPGNPATER